MLLIERAILELGEEGAREWSEGKKIAAQRRRVFSGPRGATSDPLESDTLFLRAMRMMDHGDLKMYAAEKFRRAWEATKHHLRSP